MKLTVTRPPVGRPTPLNLRHVTVIADAVGRQPLSGLREQDVLLERAASARDAGLRVDDDVVGLDQLGFGERQKRKQRGSRVATRACDEARGFDLVLSAGVAQMASVTLCGARSRNAAGRT